MGLAINVVVLSNVSVVAVIATNIAPVHDCRACVKLYMYVHLAINALIRLYFLAACAHKNAME